MNAISDFLNVLVSFALAFITLIINFFIAILQLILGFAQTIAGTGH